MILLLFSSISLYKDIMHFECTIENLREDMNMLSDIEIAQNAKMKHIRDVAGIQSA